MKSTVLTIVNRWALGDTVCLSALLRDIHRTYPGKYQTFMYGHFKSYWRHCSHTKSTEDKTVGQLVELEYINGIKAAGRGSKKHFLNYFFESFFQKTGIKVSPIEPKGEIFLSDQARSKSPYDFRYWVIVAGCKSDMTTKMWNVSSWQKTVSVLKKLDIICVQAGADFNKHFHPRLQDVIQAIGTTDDIHDFFRLIYHSEGVICGITAAMHIAAVFDKPCVVIAGGREEVSWENYSNCFYPESFGNICKPVKVEHTFLHTLGLLDCCESKGCWKDKLINVKSEFSHTNSNTLCKYPLKLAQQTVPKCMTMITPEHVVEAVMNYYEKGILPSIDKPKNTFQMLFNEVNSQKDIITDQIHMPLIVNLEEKPEDPALAVLDDPIIGGKVTIFVLCYGDHLDLAKRCIESIISNTPRNRFDLRVALNQPSDKVYEYILNLGDIVSKVYLDKDSRKKYPAMREMFWDKDHPIKTNYLIWFDDDSFCLTSKWLVQLGEVIVKNHLQGYRLYGTKFIHDLMIYKKKGFNPEKWFHEASWWKNTWMHMAKGSRLGPNGHEILFVTGGFWALCTETMRLADIPDKRLNHNGGDGTIGEQINQAGFKICDFCRDKKPVCWSDAKRRGYSEEFPWATYK